MRLSNGILLQFPADLYLIFETTSLENASPRFVQTMGFVITKENFVNWKMVLSHQLKELYSQDAFLKTLMELSFAKFSELIEKNVVTPVLLNCEG